MMLVVLECDAPLSKEQLAIVKKSAEEQLGDGFKVLVIAGGLKATVLPLPKSG